VVEQLALGRFARVVAQVERGAGVKEMKLRRLWRPCTWIGRRVMRPGGVNSFAWEMFRRLMFWRAISVLEQTYKMSMRRPLSHR
jgi:hypothetical protein